VDKNSEESNGSSDLGDEHYLTEISHLNNELINLHRELAKKNIELMQEKRAIEVLNKNLKLVNSILNHDIKNNLAIIQSAVNIYINDGADIFIGNADRATKRSFELLAQMNELSSSLDMNKPLAPLSVSEVVNQVAKSYDISVKVQGDAWVLADNGLFSLFDNLLRNAILHGKASEVVVSIQEGEGICTVAVGDNGKGIPDEIKEHIFSEGASFGPTGGTGIGLFIVSSLVYKFNGTIWVTDNEPTGAKFIIQLPSSSD